MIGKMRDGLMNYYSMKDLGPVTKFLGMNIHQDKDNNIPLFMKVYLSRPRIDCGIDLNKVLPIPLSTTVNYFDTESPQIGNIIDCQSIGGKLLFASNAKRSDVAHSVQLLSRFLKDIKEVHLKEVYRVMQYLYSATPMGLNYHKSGDKTVDGFGCIT